jgi:hypothetical protein
VFARLVALFKITFFGFFGFLQFKASLHHSLTTLIPPLREPLAKALAPPMKNFLTLSEFGPVSREAALRWDEKETPPHKDHTFSAIKQIGWQLLFGGLQLADNSI